MSPSNDVHSYDVLVVGDGAAEIRRDVGGDLVRREREESAAAHGVVGNEDRDLPLVLAVKEAATPIQNDART